MYFTITIMVKIAFLKKLRVHLTFISIFNFDAALQN